MTTSRPETKRCEWCGRVITRKNGEARANFERRETCGKSHAAFLRESRKQIDWVKAKQKGVI